MMIYKWIPMLWGARNKFRRGWALFRDERVPNWQKAILFLPVAYFFTPLNLLNFAIPIIGQIDLVLVTLLSIELLERIVDRKIIADHRRDTDELPS